MKHIKTTLAAVLAVALTGCASTSEPDRTDYPTLTVLNPTPYVWDDKKSLALNVAKMAEPAGVGVAMKDYDTASEATNGQSSTLERVFGTALMGVSQGIYGVASDQVLTNKAEAALNWKPSLVDLIPVSEIGTKLTPDSFVKVRTIIGNRIVSAIKPELADVKLHSSFTPKNTNWKENAIYVLTTDGCRDYMKFHSDKPEAAPKNPTWNWVADMMENEQLPSEYCTIYSRIAIAGTIIKDGVPNYVVVSELTMGQNFIVQMDEHYQGYILIPNRFDVGVYDGYGMRGRTLFPYTVVFSQGKPQPFVKAN